MIFHVGVLEKIAGMYSTHLIVFVFGMFASIRWLWIEDKAADDKELLSGEPGSDYRREVSDYRGFDTVTMIKLWMIKSCWAMNLGLIITEKSVITEADGRFIRDPFNRIS